MIFFYFDGGTMMGILALLRMNCEVMWGDMRSNDCDHRVIQQTSERQPQDLILPNFRRVLMAAERLPYKHPFSKKLVFEPTHLKKYESKWTSAPTRGKKFKHICNHHRDESSIFNTLFFSLRKSPHFARQKPLNILHLRSHWCGQEEL